MATSTQKAVQAAPEDFGQCEYIPFGADEKIKLSFNLILRWLAVKTKKGAVPDEQDVMKFLMVCKAKKLNPFDGDAFLVGYDGHDGPVFSTIVAHQAFLKRAETHPEFDGMESGVIVKTGDSIHELVGDFFPAGSVLVGGWATVFFVNRRHPMTKRLKLSTFDKGRSLWKTNPEGMIVKCAEADALRSSFPQLIGGMYLREEMDAGNAQASSAGSRQLQDRRGEEVPAPFSENAKARAFVDRVGATLKAATSQRYEQDDAAMEATERIRYKTTSTRPEEAQAQQEISAQVPDHIVRQDFVYKDVMQRCRSIDTTEAGDVLQKEIVAHLEAKSLTDEQASDLHDILKYNLENLQ